MLIKNIEWDIVFSEISDIISDISLIDISEIFDISNAKIMNMPMKHIKEWVLNKLQIDPEATIKFVKFMDLPSEVDIPDNYNSESDIVNYLYYEGFCVKSYEIKDGKNIKKVNIDIDKYI